MSVSVSVSVNYLLAKKSIGHVNSIPIMQCFWNSRAYSVKLWCHHWLIMLSQHKMMHCENIISLPDHKTQLMCLSEHENWYVHQVCIRVVVVMTEGSSQCITNELNPQEDQLVRMLNFDWLILDWDGQRCVYAIRPDIWRKTIFKTRFLQSSLFVIRKSCAQSVEKRLTFHTDSFFCRIFQHKFDGHRFFAGKT